MSSTKISTRTIPAASITTGDAVAVGAVGDALAEQAGIDRAELDQHAWLTVVRCHHAADGFTDLTVELPDGEKMMFDFPSFERVTISSQITTLTHTTED